MKEESEKAGLKLSIKKKKKKDHGIWFHHFMANRRENVEAVTNSLFLGSKTTVDGDCSHEIRRRLLLGRKAMTNPDLKAKTTLLTKVCIAKASVKSRLWSFQ